MVADFSRVKNKKFCFKLVLSRRGEHLWDTLTPVQTDTPVQAESFREGDFSPPTLAQRSRLRRGGEDHWKFGLPDELPRRGRSLVDLVYANSNPRGGEAAISGERG